MKPIVTGSLVALTALSMTANALMYLRYSSSRPLVTVGSQVISKKDYQDALDYQTQGAVLKKLVLADLINQAAAKAGITPSDADVDARLNEISRASPQIVASALEDPARTKQLRQDIRTQIALENLQIAGVTVSDADVAQFYDHHEKNFKLPTQIHATMVIAENSVDAAEASSLLQHGIALDVIARQPRLHVVGMNGFNINGGVIPAALNQKLTAAVFRMKTGNVQTVAAGKDYFVLRATQESASGVPPLSQVRPQVERMARLEKGVPAPVEVARLYQQAQPQFAVARYSAYFSDLSAPLPNASRGAEKTADAQ